MVVHTKPDLEGKIKKLFCDIKISNTTYKSKYCGSYLPFNATHENNKTLVNANILLGTTFNMIESRKLLNYSIASFKRTDFNPFDFSRVAQEMYVKVMDEYLLF